jgi:hypothetical protein
VGPIRQAPSTTTALPTLLVKMKNGSWSPRPTLRTTAVHRGPVLPPPLHPCNHVPLNTHFSFLGMSFMLITFITYCRFSRSLRTKNT